MNLAHAGSTGIGDVWHKISGAWENAVAPPRNDNRENSKTTRLFSTISITKNN